MVIKTKRIYIRDLIPGDWSDMQKIFKDFNNSEYAIYDAPLPTSDEKVKELTIQFAESRLFFSVFLQDLSSMIGYVCFHNNNGCYDLGFCFHSAYQGNGYAFEACNEMLNYFQQKYKVKCFTAGTALKNIPACRLLERLGFVLEKTERLSFHKDKEGKDIVFEGGNFIRCNELG